MSVIETVKEKIGMGPDQDQYRCDECDQQFGSDADPDSYWFECPNCGADDATPLEN